MAKISVDYQDEWRAACADIARLHPRLIDLAYAIQKYEGFAIGTRAYRNNNPGNLRSSIHTMNTDEDGFAVFTTYYHGLYALLWDLSCKCIGQTQTGLGPDSTLKELFHVYAPVAENDTEAYWSFVASSLELQPDTKLREIMFHG